MEEYFPPIGTDHQILEGQEAGFRFSLLAVFLGVFALLVGGAISFFIWQQRVSFAVPDTEVMAVVPADGQEWLRDASPLALPEPWTKPVADPGSTLIVGGTLSGPDWLIAPVWRGLPDGFEPVERHGLFRLAAREGSSASSTFPLSLKSAKQWLDPIKGALGASRFRPSQGEPLTFIWNEHLLRSSLPFETVGTLSDKDDVSYALQKNAFDESFLKTVFVNGQGLSPWRKELARVSWTGAEANRSWELVFNDAASPALGLLAFASSSTRAFYLDDGSATRVFVGAGTSSTGNVVRLGAAPEATGTVCMLEGFKPFLRIRGQALKQASPFSFFPFEALSALEAGSSDGFLSLCF